MKRLLRLRLSLLLIGLAAIPVTALPFAEQIRAEWKRYWEPKLSTSDRLRADLACVQTHIRLIDQDVEAGWFQYIEGETSIVLVETAELQGPAVVESGEAPNVPIVHQLSEEHRLRFLEELADMREGMTDPSDAPTGRTMDAAEAPEPNVEP